MASVQASLLKAAVGQIADVSALLRDGLGNIPDDEAVLSDALSDVALADPALAPQIALVEALAPIAVQLAIWLAENNQSARPGAVAPPFAGGTAGRGSDPWLPK